MPAIPCGLYEVDEPGGSTVPVRVHHHRPDHRRHPDQWAMSWLLGHDGRTWEEFAVVTDTALLVEPRFRESDYDTVGTMLFKHMRDGECFDGWAFRLKEARCARCGRLLKPGENGISPGCAKEWGL
jgi:hypothetical protein